MILNTHYHHTICFDQDACKLNLKLVLNLATNITVKNWMQWELQPPTTTSNLLWQRTHWKDTHRLHRTMIVWLKIEVMSKEIEYKIYILSIGDAGSNRCKLVLILQLWIAVQSIWCTLTPVLSQTFQSWSCRRKWVEGGKCQELLVSYDIYSKSVKIHKPTAQALVEYLHLIFGNQFPILIYSRDDVHEM